MLRRILDGHPVWVTCSNCKHRTIGTSRITSDPTFNENTNTFICDSCYVRGLTGMDK